MQLKIPSRSQNQSPARNLRERTSLEGNTLDFTSGTCALGVRLRLA